MKPSTLLKSSIVYCLLPITSRSAELSLSEEFYEYFNVDKATPREEQGAEQ
ncbi:MAG: hypothetical protein KJ592_04575 [Nanoarchaeota archaeon]|nr:hypothetical protein [Nanoarchaeota archaeon]